MRVVGYKTPRLNETFDLAQLIIDTIAVVPEDAVIVVSSKIVSIAEGSVIPKNAANDREQLIKDQADKWLDPNKSKYRHHFTIKHNTLVGSAGIDSSNGGDNFVLLPKRPQATANELRSTLTKHYTRPVGVIITDSTSIPLRRGSVGTCLAHSGFEALRSYIGDKDIFGHTFQHSVANLAQGIAAAATLVMGEGAEQTPLVVVSDIPHFVCIDQNPTEAELDELYPDMAVDLFEPFWEAIGWKQKEKGS